jgi:outer membrane protein assembly factor BamB
MKTSLYLALIAAQSAFTIFAQTSDAAAGRNWPQWRGPWGTGVSPTANPPLHWSETSNLLWKIKLPGNGASTPIIWEQQVFIQTSIPKANDAGTVEDTAEALTNPKRNFPAGASGPDIPGIRNSPPGPRSIAPDGVQQFTLLSLDRQTGAIRWQKVAREEKPHEGHHPDHGFASHSPITDGQRVYAYFGSHGLHAYDLQGNLKWEKDLGRMRTRNAFGEGSSPAISGDRLVINWDHEGDDFIAAFDTETGREIWRQPREEPTSWATPIIVTNGAQAQVVTAATQKIRAYDLATGKLLWECEGLTANVIPTPVAWDGTVYPISGFRGNALLAIRLGASGDLTGTDAIAWSYKKNTPYVPSPLLYDGRLYFYSGNDAKLTCLDAKSGAVLMDAQKVESLKGIYSSPVGAAGRIYLASRNGATEVIKNAPVFESLATNPLDDEFIASPALAGNQIFLRGKQFLYCIEAK